MHPFAARRPACCRHLKYPSNEKRPPTWTAHSKPITEMLLIRRNAARI
jgi:hypothetical protein